MRNAVNSSTGGHFNNWLTPYSNECIFHRLWEDLKCTQKRETEMKFFTSAIAIALATAAFAVPAQAAGTNWSVVGVWGGSSEVAVTHAQGGKKSGMLTLVEGSEKVTILGIQANGSKRNLQGTGVFNSDRVDVTTYQDGKNNIAGTLVVDSSKTSVYTEQTSNNNLSLVGVSDSEKVNVVVVQGALTTAPAQQ